MNTQKITAIALRLISIWLLIQVVLNISSVVMLLASIDQYQQREMPTFGYIGIIGVVLVVGIAAVFLLYKLASSVLNRTADESGADISKDSQKFLLQLAGAFFVVTALAYMPRSLSFLLRHNDVTAQNLLWPSGLLFQLVVGIWLVSSTKFWFSVFQKIRGRA